jgi:hypothetical protein
VPSFLLLSIHFDEDSTRIYLNDRNKYFVILAATRDTGFVRVLCSHFIMVCTYEDRDHHSATF